MSTPIRLIVSRQLGQTTLYGEGSVCELQAGTQYDNNAFTLCFIRDDAYRADSLVLYFSQGSESYRVLLGTGNQYPLPEALTQGRELRLEAAFARGAEELEHSNTITLRFREGIAASNEEPPDPISPGGWTGQDILVKYLD